MKCNQIVRLLPPFLDGEMAGKAQVTVSDHLASCPACRRELEGLKADMAFLCSVEATEPNQYLPTRVMAEIRKKVRPERHRLGRLAATLAGALVVAVSIGAGVFFGSGLAAGVEREAGSTESALAYVESSTTDLYSVMTGGE